MPTLCETFRRQASFVWHNMSKAAAKGLWLSEETLTELVQFNIATLHQGKGFVVDLATKPQESKHGADWEWWFTRGSKGFGFRVQAKRLFPSHSYQSLLHGKSGPYEQLDKLVLRAAADGLIPLYCFYNFSHKPNSFAGMSNTCRHEYRLPSFWGCSIASPHEVKKAGSNNLGVLKAAMVPWHTLVCKSDTLDLVSAIAAFAAERNPAWQDFERDLPPRVSRIVEMGDARRKSEAPSYIDQSYWDKNGSEEQVTGIAVYRDIRPEEKLPRRQK